MDFYSNTHMNTEETGLTSVQNKLISQGAEWTKSNILSCQILFPLGHITKGPTILLDNNPISEFFMKAQSVVLELQKFSIYFSNFLLLIIIIIQNRATQFSQCHDNMKNISDIDYWQASHLGGLKGSHQHIYLRVMCSSRYKNNQVHDRQKNKQSPSSYQLCLTIL